MSSDAQIREFLDRMAGEPFVGPLDPEPLVRRARRRAVRTVAVGALAAVALAVSAVGGVALLRSSPGIPADRETVSPAPPPPLMRNGPLTVFGFTNGVRQVNVDGSSTDPVVECKPRYTCTETNGAAWSPDGTRLAFTPECAGGCGSAGAPYHGLRVLDVRTGEDLLLIPGDDLGAVEWSPDGTRIAYTTGGRVGTPPDPGGEIFVVNADGTDPTRLANTTNVGSMSWSPDGTRLAYSDDGSQMFVVTLDGSEPVPLGSGVGPHWSRDGSRLAYLNGCDIWTMHPDGTSRSRLATFADATDRCPSVVSTFQPGPVWSPDGSTLAVWIDPVITLVDASSGDVRRLELGLATGIEGITWRPVAAASSSTTQSDLAPVLRPGERIDAGIDGAIVAVDASTGDERVLARCEGGCSTLGSPVISPDGRWLAYEDITCIGSSPCEPEAGLWVTNALGEHRQLTHSCPALDACVPDPWAWMPLGATIVHALDSPDAGLQTIDVSSGETRTLAHPPGAVNALALSPDGSQLAYAVEDPASLFVYDLEADALTPVQVKVGSVVDLQWSPDGTRMLLDDVLGDRSRIVVTDVQGNDARVLVEGPAAEGPGAPTWSPDGTRIAYGRTPLVGDTRNRFSFEVWVTRADGSNPTEIYASGCCITGWHGPRWSPDGTRLAFTDDRSAPDGSWLVANADGSGAIEHVSAADVSSWA
jgi:Tol biopolymer transport system component